MNNELSSVSGQFLSKFGLEDQFEPATFGYEGDPAGRANNLPQLSPMFMR